MKRTIVITDLTRMKPPRVCIGGYFWDEGTCVRPIIPHQEITESFLYVENTLVIKPFALVELDFIRPKPDPPHSEDWEIHPTHRRLITNELTDEQKRDFLNRIVDPSISSIFKATIHDDTYVLYGQGERSLGTIHPKEVIGVEYEPLRTESKWDYRITLSDAGNHLVRLPVTDLAFRECCEARLRGGTTHTAIALSLKNLFNDPETYTFIRVGLARRWARRFPDRCYIQITGIYTFPDYLQGRNFADCRSSASS